jgi:hypothetical protein
MNLTNMINNYIEEKIKVCRLIRFHSKCNRYSPKKMYFNIKIKAKQKSCSHNLSITYLMKIFNSLGKFKSIIYTRNSKTRLWISISSKLMATRTKAKSSKMFKTKIYSINSKFKAHNFKITILDKDLWTTFKTLNKIFKIQICKRTMWPSTSAINSTRTNSGL